MDRFETLLKTDGPDTDDNCSVWRNENFIEIRMTPVKNVNKELFYWRKIWSFANHNLHGSFVKVIFSIYIYIYAIMNL
jgi:hypothetical protein